MSTTKIRLYLLVVIETEGEKRAETTKPQKVYISPHRPDDPFYPIATNFGRVGDVHDVIKRANFGDDRMIGVSSAGS